MRRWTNSGITCDSPAGALVYASHYDVYALGPLAPRRIVGAFGNYPLQVRIAQALVYFGDRK